MVVGTFTADHGEASPSAALLAFVFTFEDGPDATGVERLIVPERRATIVKQWRAYLAQMADTKATEWSATFEVGSSMPGDRVETRGDRATVVDSYRVRWTPPADEQHRMASSGPVLWFNGTSRQWWAEARKDRIGWRLWSVMMPPWCGQDSYSRCNSSRHRVHHPVRRPHWKTCSVGCGPCCRVDLRIRFGSTTTAHPRRDLDVLIAFTTMTEHARGDLNRGIRCNSAGNPQGSIHFPSPLRVDAPVSSTGTRVVFGFQASAFVLVDFVRLFNRLAG